MRDFLTPTPVDSMAAPSPALESKARVDAAMASTQDIAIIFDFFKKAVITE